MTFGEVCSGENRAPNFAAQPQALLGAAVNSSSLYKKMSKNIFFVHACHVGSTKKLSIQEKRVFMQNTRFFLV